MRPDKLRRPKSLPSCESRDAWRRDLAEALVLLRSPDEALRFLADICTPGEMVDLADRWHVAKLLDEGQHSYRDIHALTGISVTTVARVARFLQQEPHKGYRLILDRMKSSAKG